MALGNELLHMTIKEAFYAIPGQPLRKVMLMALVAMTLLWPVVMIPLLLIGALGYGLWWLGRWLWRRAGVFHNRYPWVTGLLMLVAVFAYWHYFEGLTFKLWLN